MAILKNASPLIPSHRFVCSDCSRVGEVSEWPWCGWSLILSAQPFGEMFGPSSDNLRESVLTWRCYLCTLFVHLYPLVLTIWRCTLHGQTKNNYLVHNFYLQIYGQGWFYSQDQSQDSSVSIFGILDGVIWEYLKSEVMAAFFFETWSLSACSFQIRDHIASIS